MCSPGVSATAAAMLDVERESTRMDQEITPDFAGRGMGEKEMVGAVQLHAHCPCKEGSTVTRAAGVRKGAVKVAGGKYGYLGK